MHRVAARDLPATLPRGRRRSNVERLVLRRLVLLGTPLVLAVLEIFHPHPSGVADAVEQGGGSYGSTSSRFPSSGSSPSPSIS
jgi:hypothetical protein